MSIRFAIAIALATSLAGGAAPAQAGERPYVVVVDAGHGGHDPGALSPSMDGRPEKSVTLAIARKIRDLLTRRRDVRIIMTRDRDRFLSLVARRRVAEANRADLFLSIHADSAPDATARGASIYRLTEDGRPLVVRRMAEAEQLDGIRLASLDPDSAAILGDLKQRYAMNDSADFATALAADLSSACVLRSQPILSAGFAVLKAQGVPAVLLETGYLTNHDDARMLFSDRGQNRIAKAVAEAIEHTAMGEDS